MPRGTKTILLMAGLIGAAGFIAWPGCVTAPLPSSRKPIEARKISDFAFKKNAGLTRDEIVSRLGEPDAYVSDIDVACYRVNSVTRRDVLLCLFVLPVYFSKTTNEVEIAFLQFDGRNQVRRSGVGFAQSRMDITDSARRWLMAQNRKSIR